MLDHMVMARKEVLVQLEDGLIRELDRIAKERGTNRSELLGRLSRGLIEADEEFKADVELVAAYRAMPPDASDLDWLARHAAENAIVW